MEAELKNQYKKCMHLFTKCNRLHHALVEQRVSDLGLHRSQHAMLLTVNFSGGICQKDLAQRMEISPAAVTVTLKKLEAQGFIKRSQAKEDSRVNNIAVTPKGKDIIDKTAIIFDEVDELTFEGFSDEEIQQLIGYTQRIAKNLKSSFACKTEK